MADAIVSAKLDEETDLHEDFEEFQKDYQTKSEAVRAAIRDGISEDSGTDSPPFATAAMQLAVWVPVLFSIALGALIPAAIGTAPVVGWTVFYIAIFATIGAGLTAIVVYHYPERVRSILSPITGQRNQEVA
ncbi:MAG: hypothetical protein ABEI98_08565 [Halorhabdus sp.]